MNQIEFKNELKLMNIEPTEFHLEQLQKYYNLVIESNKVMNLTGITEENEFYLKHFYDSLTLNKVIDLSKIESLCDLGSGAGFPGIVLKIIFPAINITLVDSLTKRTDFLNCVIKNLNLEGINVINSRIEDYSRINREKFDIVTARAVTNNQILLEIGSPLVKVGGSFVSMKGKDEEDIKNLGNTLKELNLSFRCKESFLLPIEKSERTLLEFKKEKATNIKYPRTFDKIKKRPL